MQISRKLRPEILDSVALLVLDAQDCFIETLPNKSRFLNRAAFALEAARCLQIRTIFTEQAPEKLGHTNADLFRLARNPKVFAKQSFSALGAPGIERYLREQEIYHLLIIGLETPICVYQTGLQATEEDIDVTFLSDALAARRPEDEAHAINALTRLGCQVLPSETIFYSLLGDVQSPYFRPFNQIVKAFGAEDFDLEAYLPKRPEPITFAKPEPRDSRQERREQPKREKEEQDPSSDSEERQGRKRGRRRGRGRGRGRKDEDRSEPPSEKQDSQPESSAPSQVERPESPAPEKAESKPEQKAPEPKPQPDKSPPAKKAAKKTAKKAAKKVAKKTARKATKKVAKKAAKKVAKKTSRPEEAS